MGGKALKNTPTRRLPRAAYERVALDVCNGLRLALPAARVDVIPAYADKADFGDLDVLLSSDGVAAAGGGDVLERLARERFHATELFKNGDVLSFDYRATANQVEPGFQVDLITMPAQAYDYALAYFSYNDLGNLIGRTAHKAGLAHRHDGLMYYVRDGDYLFREIVLTRDYDSALRFLGYDPQRFRQGFGSLEGIFAYVAGSAYFNRDIFLLENRNYRARVRDRKRATYMAFLDWCETRPELPAFPYPEDKQEWLPRIAAHFPHFQAAYDRALADLAEQRAVKAKFNGAWVSQLTGLQGKELGGLMKRFKESFETPAAMQAFILDHGVTDIEARVRRLLAQPAGEGA